MECPRCGKDTLSADGICPVCNYQVELKGSSSNRVFNRKETENASQSIGQDASTDPAPVHPEDKIPQWQKELSQRLADIKQKKETHENSGQPQSQSTSPTPDAAPVKAPMQQPRTPTEHAGSILVRRHTPEAPSSAGSAGSDAPQQKTIASLGPEVYTADKAAENSDSKDIKDLIDKTVSSRSIHSAPKSPVFRQKSPAAEENKLILLSRTLSGLIDLIIVVLCTAVFIISADYFSGIVILDTVSIVEYAGLFLLVFLLYSIFFLATSGQTVGMMITDLRIIAIQGSRPSIGQLFSRCFGYLLSVIVFGVGLLWSLFDRNNMCFHDRFSNTSITRI
ncbi:MAG: RDD family protein [Acidobacteria bacterium]|nr:RDD family protein [Acidobacteriota bacterium]